MEYEYGLLMSRNYGFLAILMFTRRGDSLTFDFPYDKSLGGNFNEVILSELDGKTLVPGESLYTELQLSHLEGKPLLKGRYIETGTLPEIRIESKQFDHPLDMLVTDARDIFFPDFDDLAKRVGAPDYDEHSLEVFLRDKLRSHVNTGLSNHARCVYLLKERSKLQQEISKMTAELNERRANLLF
jgi:hypothetical protein